MSEDLKKLLRLIDIHSKLVEKQIDVVNEYGASIASCDMGLNGVLLSMQQYENGGTYLSGTFSEKLRNLAQNKANLEKDIEKARIEQRRLSVIVDKLTERHSDLAEANAEIETSDALDEWMSALRRES